MTDDRARLEAANLSLEENVRRLQSAVDQLASTNQVLVEKVGQAEAILDAKELENVHLRDEVSSLQSQFKAAMRENTRVKEECIEKSIEAEWRIFQLNEGRGIGPAPVERPIKKEESEELEVKPPIA